MGRVTGLMAGGLWTLDSVMGKIDRRERQVMSLQTFIPDLSTSSRHTLSPFPFFTELTEHMRLSHSRACKMIIIRHSTVIIAHRLPFIFHQPSHHARNLKKIPLLPVTVRDNLDAR